MKAKALNLILVICFLIVIIEPVNLCGDINPTIEVIIMAVSSLVTLIIIGVKVKKQLKSF
jgi:hypothetical protein